MVTHAGRCRGCVPRRAAPGRRSASVTERNVGALRSGATGWCWSPGFFEPVLYLLSIGVGVGALVGDLDAARRRRWCSYAAFVAPAMLAVVGDDRRAGRDDLQLLRQVEIHASCTTAMLATPVRPFEIALGELAWAMIRGSLYSAAFLVDHGGDGPDHAGWALAAFPATMLVGFAFGALGMALSHAACAAGRTST